MKLVFPNGEHPQVLLNAGINRIGSAPDGVVVLDHAGVVPVHCEIHQSGIGVNLQVPAGGGLVLVNNKPVNEMIALRAGDDINIGGIIARVAPADAPRAAPSSGTTGSFGSADADSGATRMRAAVPKFVLRGVSGPVFGKMYPVTGPTVIGRAPECTIPVGVDEISRRHCELKPVADGLSVEDLGSANGTYINGQRVQKGFMKAGDELRLDAVRFMLVAPGQEVNTVRRMESVPTPSSGNGKWVAVVVIVVVIAAIAAWKLLQP